MSMYTDLEELVRAHRPHGGLTPRVGAVTPNGYRLTVACVCSVTFERWVLPQDAEEDLLRSRLTAFEN